MTQQELNSYPTAPLGDKVKQAQVDYVLAIVAGDSKEEAYSKFFPERYGKIKGDTHRVRNAIYSLEQGEYVSKMMKTANKQAYSRFFGKVDKVLNRVYNIAMDEECDIKDSLAAANTFMKHVPKAPDAVEEAVEDIKDQYKNFLLDRHKFMTQLANQSAIDVEVVDEIKYEYHNNHGRKQ